MTKFADIPGYIIEEYLDKISSFSTPNEYDDFSADGGYIVSHNNMFVTQNTDPMKLFAKSEETDYRDVRANVIKDWKNGESKITFRRLLSKEITPSNDVQRVTTEDSYQQTTYDYISSEDEYQYDINQGDEIYTRKDSLFRSGIIDNGDRFNDYVNIQKPFLYLGNGYKKGDYVEVYYYGLKDGVKEAFPINNRSERLDIFLDIVFDKFFSKMYNKQKNIISLIDPFEVESELLDGMVEYYNTALLSLDIEEFKKRIFIDNLINGLKQHGTYASLFVIGNILSRNTQNQMTVYDRWHECLDSGTPCPYDYFEDYDYTKYYESWTSPNSADYPITYDLNNKVLSTHYKVQFGVNNNPFSDGYILSKELTNDLYTKWEECRPITRVSHYETNLETITDFTGKEYSLYTDPLYDANILSATTLFTEASSGAALAVQTSPKDVWTFDHNLDTEDVIIDVYNIDLERIYPQTIEVVHNNRVRIYFPEKVLGTVLILKSDYSRYQGFQLDTGTINHLLNSKYVIPQFREDSEVTVVQDITALDVNNLEAETQGLSGSAYIADIQDTFVQSTPSDTGTIKHDFGYVGVIIDTYDENDQVVIPDQVVLQDRETTVAYFNEPIKGYAGLRPVGNPKIGGDIKGIFQGIGKVEFGNAEDTRDWDYALKDSVKNPIGTFYYDSNNFSDYDNGYKFDITVPKGYEGYITEMAIFDIKDNLSFYFRGNPLYKHNEIILDIDYIISNENLT